MQDKTISIVFLFLLATNVTQYHHSSPKMSHSKKLSLLLLLIYRGQLGFVNPPLISNHSITVNVITILISHCDISVLPLISLHEIKGAF